MPEFWSAKTEGAVRRLMAEAPRATDRWVRDHAERLAALPVGWDLWSYWFLRPNGEVVIIGEDEDHPGVDSVYSDRVKVLSALAGGSRLYPELRQFLPQREPGATDCECLRFPDFFGPDKVICPACGGVGWLPAAHSRSDSAGLRSPNHKDIAEFARLALRYRLLPGPAVVAWADSVIAENEHAPLWAIDLSLARPEELEEASRAVPGEPQGDLPVRLLLALVRRLWRSAGLTIGEVRGIGWDLYRAFPHQLLWGACLEEEGDLFDSGYGTEVALRASIDEKLAPYEVDDAMLPAWVQSS